MRREVRRKHGVRASHAALLLTAAGLCGCATIESSDAYQKTRDVTEKAVTAVADTAKSARERMKHYLAEKDLLKTFHDSGEHDEAAVLGVLHKVGIGARGAKQPSPPPAGAKPPAPATGATPAPTPSTGQAAPLPAQYTGHFRWPLDAGIISSEFGPRWGRVHKGIDIAAETGEPVYAAAAGDVLYAGNGLRGYGNVVIVRHDQQTTTVYAHNSALKVYQGEHVKQGELIALVGSTGRSTGPHSHFEIREGDEAINPRKLLPPPPY